MLTAEQIKSELDAAKKSNEWAKSRMDLLSDLDPSLRAIGHLLLGRDGAGKELTDMNAWQVRGEAAEQLLPLNEEETLALGSRIFHRFPDVFRAAWDLHARLPVMTGYLRKPFRAPTRSDLLLPIRKEFLAGLAANLEGYDQGIDWLAAHATHIASYQGTDHLGKLFAAAIDVGGTVGERVESTLREAAAGTHETASFGQHVTIGMLCSAKQDCWEFIEKLLLAAQRQEGLRQSILETIDFSHPDAFRRMLRTIDENNLVRFSATVRAVDVWMGFQLDSVSGKYVQDTLHFVTQCLNDPNIQQQALAGSDPEQAFVALWSIAFDDLAFAPAPARRLMQHEKPEIRFVGIHLLSMLHMDEFARDFEKCLDDPDPRVAVHAASAIFDLLQLKTVREAGPISRFRYGAYRPTTPIPPENAGQAFEKLEALYERLPEKSKPSKPLVWPWMQIKINRDRVADGMIYAIGKRPIGRLLKYLDAMSPNARLWMADLIARQESLDKESRAALLALVGDASGSVREHAVQAMLKVKISAADLSVLEPLLTRKASDLRRGVIGLILALPDDQCLASARRLLASRDAGQRHAGLDLLVQMRDANRSPDDVRALVEEFDASSPNPDRDTQVYLEKLLSDQHALLSLDNALGLMDPGKRTPPLPPVSRGARLCTAATVQVLRSLDELVHQHRDTVIELKRYNGDTEQQLLGTIRYGLPQPVEHNQKEGKCVRPFEELYLYEVWQQWLANRPETEHDEDGFELLRASLVTAIVSEYDPHDGVAWRKSLFESLCDATIDKLRYPSVLQNLLGWFLHYHRPANAETFALDAIETVLASVPADKLTETSDYGSVQFRAAYRDLLVLVHQIYEARELKTWTNAQALRFFGLLRWIDEPGVQVARERPDWQMHLLAAFEAGIANTHDVYDHLLGPRAESRYYGAHFDAIADGSQRLRRDELSPQLRELVQQAIDRVLEVELQRGESETPASAPALSLRFAGHTDVLMRILDAVGRDPKLQRTYSWGDASRSKSSVLSHLIRVTFPARDETPEGFARAVKRSGVNEDVLLAVAFYAPQWARFIEASLGWADFAEAVWWFHAHTKDQMWRVEAETREGWNAEIRKLTPLSLEDLMEGAVDVDWFARVYKSMGKKRWARLNEFAKYASGGAGHTRAQLFANAMLGEVKLKDVKDTFQKKRKQDAVRALGLLPLAAKDKKKDVLDRYKLMQEFIRTSRQFGSQRQASEKLAARIGQENLARTAGYADPVRLQWAMEGLACADLAKGAVTVKVKDVTVSLAIADEGLPEVTVARSGKPLKAIPPEAKKNPKVVELNERKTELRRSASRMRHSLELAMCRGDRFTTEELLELLANPILKPMLERLVFVADKAIGYPVRGGKALRDFAGKTLALEKRATLRLAHSTDLYRTKQWSKWQRECFEVERVQPFKQVFRELYLITDQEKKDSTFSRRYAGQQVNPRQAMALLASRGWVTAPEAGIFRMFPEEKLVAWIEFMEAFYTPAEIEGLTLEKVRFAQRGKHEHVKLTDVPPHLFSEAMRDVDLIVSVAHRGNVDPEASASTVEMRATLLKETIALLKLKNVKVQTSHALIKGEVGEYSVHLGSATTHMMLGGALFIVPVHSQHRGRIFLPFADDDPKTAEVISKVLLLARDQEIRDPNLLMQIRTNRQ